MLLTRLDDNYTDPDDPSSDGGDSTGDSPPDHLMEYLNSHVDTLQIDESNVTRILRQGCSPVIFTEVFESSRDYLQGHTDLIIRLVGYRGGSSLILAAVPAEIDDPANELEPDFKEIRSGSLVRFSSKELEGEEQKAVLDFVVGTQDDRIVGAISDTAYSTKTSDLFQSLKSSVTATVLGHWVSTGEEGIIVDSRDMSILDYYDSGPQIEGYDCSFAHSVYINNYPALNFNSGIGVNYRRYAALGAVVVALLLFAGLFFNAFSTWGLPLTAGLTAIGFIFLFFSMMYDDFRRAARN